MIIKPPLKWGRHQKLITMSKIKKVFTDEQVEQLMQASGGGALGARFRCIIAVMWMCGLRIGEALDLKPSDIDWSENKIRIRNGKGGNDDWTVMPNAFRPYYDGWMAHRKKVDLPKASPLFCVLSKSVGKRIYPQYIWNRMKQLGKKLFGEDEPCHPHMLRRTCATRRLRKGYDLTSVASFLRHKTTASTHHYLVIANKEDLAKKAADDW